MRADDDERLRRATDRQNEELARRLEAAERPGPSAAAGPPSQEVVPGVGAEPGQPQSAPGGRDGGGYEGQPPVPPPEIARPAEEMQVEEGGEEELMGSLLAEVRKLNPSRRLNREATRLFELLLTTGVSPGDARAKIVELYSPPRATSEMSTLPDSRWREGRLLISGRTPMVAPGISAWRATGAGQGHVSPKRGRFL